MTASPPSPFTPQISAPYNTARNSDLALPVDAAQAGKADVLPLQALDRKLHARPVLALGSAKEIFFGAPGQRPVTGFEPLGYAPGR